MTKIFVIAGEDSGDLIAADLIRQLKQDDPSVEIAGIGAAHMLDAGLPNSLFPMSDLSIMGLVEVIKHLPRLLRRMAQTKQAIAQFQPDVLLTVDAPDFCLRIAQWTKKKFPQIKCVHTVAPTVWAWRPGRAKKIAQFLDGILCLFPFEPSYFTEHGLKAAFIGHPLVHMIEPVNDATKQNFFKRYLLSQDQPVLCLLPGSRVREIESLLPTFLQTAKQLRLKNPDLQVILPTLSRLEQRVQDMIDDSGVPVTLVMTQDDKYTAMQISTAALHASGTVALELALCGTPMVTAYHVSALSAWVARRLIRINNVNLVNIILNHNIVPEYLQEDCTVENLYAALDMLMNGQGGDVQRNALAGIRAKLQPDGSSIALIK